MTRCDYCGKKIEPEIDYGQEIGYYPIHKNCWFKKNPQLEHLKDKKFTLDFGGHNPFLQAKKEKEMMDKFYREKKNINEYTKWRMI